MAEQVHGAARSDAELGQRRGERAPQAVRRQVADELLVALHEDGGGWVVTRPSG